MDDVVNSEGAARVKGYKQPQPAPAGQRGNDLGRNQVGGCMPCRPGRCIVNFVAMTASWL